MSETTSTPFSSKCDILADLWIQYKNADEFEDFIDYNDLGLPLAYAVSTNIVEANDRLTTFINETWNLLLAGLDIEDVGFDNLPDLIGLAGTK